MQLLSPFFIRKQQYLNKLDEKQYSCQVTILSSNNKKQKGRKQNVTMELKQMLIILIWTLSHIDLQKYNMSLVTSPMGSQEASSVYCLSLDIIKV